MQHSVAVSLNARDIQYAIKQHTRKIVQSIMGKKLRALWHLRFVSCGICSIIRLFLTAPE